MTVTLDLLTLALGGALILRTALVHMDRRRNSAGLAALGFYALLFPVAFFLVARVSTRSNNFLSPADFVLILSIALLSVAAISLGLHLLGVRVRFVVGALLTLNLAVPLLALLPGVLAVLSLSSADLTSANRWITILFLLSLLGLSGDLLLLIVFVAAGVIQRQSRRATCSALLLGGLASVVETVLLYTRGLESWHQTNGVVVVAVGAALAVAVFSGGRKLCG